MRTQSEFLNYIDLNHNTASGKPVHPHPALKRRFAKVSQRNLPVRVLHQSPHEKPKLFNNNDDLLS
jgi:hypothetical protein